MSPEKINTNLSVSSPGQNQAISKRAPDSVGRDEARAHQAGKRRRAAADWVERLTGIAVSTASDKHFRDSLKDGTLLCQVLNIIRPGCITQVSNQQLIMQSCCYAKLQVMLTANAFEKIQDASANCNKG